MVCILSQLPGAGLVRPVTVGILIVEFFVFISEQWVLVSVLLILIYLFAINERIKSGRPLSVHAVTRMINADEALLLDIRDSKEFKAGHIAGAVNIPQAKLSDKLAELDEHREKFIIIADKVGQNAGIHQFRYRKGPVSYTHLTLPTICSV